MYVKFWGTRGSTPRAFTHDDILRLLQRLKASGKVSLDDVVTEYSKPDSKLPLSFGGDTICIEVGSNNKFLFVDMGSGFRQAGTEAMKAGTKEFHILVTHMHWDHVLGLPFFRPIFAKDSILNIYHVHKEAPEFIKVNFNGINFPVSWDQLPSKIVFHQLKAYEQVNICGMKVEPFRLDHPGESFGYRIEAKQRSVGIGFDGEYTRRTRAELGEDLKYYQNLDLLIFDAQYTLAELESRKGWGHSTPTVGCDIGVREGIKRLAFIHHDPWSDFDKLISMWDEAKSHTMAILPQFKDVWKNQPSGPELIYAYDRLQINLGE